MKRLWTGLVFAGLCSVSTAQALTLSGLIGGSAISGSAPDAFSYNSPSFLLGAEATLGVTSLIEVGGFFDYNVLEIAGSVPNYGGITGPMDFFGVVTRVRIAPELPWLFDLKLGLTTQSVGDTSLYAPNGTDLGFGFGLGVAYDLPLGSIVSLRPRIGYRFLPYDVVDQHTYVTNSFDFGLLASFKL